MVNFVNRARDVRHLIQTEGMEKGVIKSLERLAEDNEMLRQEMTQLVQNMDRMANIVADIATVGVKLKNDWAEVRKRFHPDNEAGEDIQ